jgi:hypothetical protein
MASQNQNIDGSQIENSQVQLVQAEQTAVSFQNSQDNQVTINHIILRLFGQPVSSSVDWDWAHRLLKDKQLPEIRTRLIDTLGRDRSLMQLSMDQQLSWVGRLEANRRLQVQGEDRGILDMRQMLIETFGQDDIAGKLLILGTPGAGKTTALLSLVEQLVCGAINQPKTVIPVLFELSTWRNDSQSIHDWLIEQLYEVHGGNCKAKRYEQWLEQQVLLPLLDGLDEPGLERQKQCTLKLNEFARHYPQLVVCCRVKEFAQANVKLDNLRGAVCLEPLTDEQIQDYLNTVKRPDLWSTIQSTPALQNLLELDEEGDVGLLRVPLFLSLFARAYDSQYPFQNKTELLEQYVEQQLSKDVRESDRRKEVERRQWAYKTPELEPKRQETQKTLYWLAQTLKDENQIEFLIEDIQPYNLNDKLQQWQYWAFLFIGNLLTTGAIATVVYSQWVPANHLVSWSSTFTSILLFGLLGGFVLSTGLKADGARLISYPFAALYCLLSQKKLPRFYKYIPILHHIDLSFKLRLKPPSLKDLRDEVFAPSLEMASSIAYYIFAPLIPTIVAVHMFSGGLAYLIGMKRLGIKLKKSYARIRRRTRLSLGNTSEFRYPHHALTGELSFQYVKMIKENGELPNLMFSIFTCPSILLTFVFFLITNLVSAILTEEMKETSTPNQGLQESLKVVFLVLILFHVFSFLPFLIQNAYYRIIFCVLGVLVCSSYLPLIQHFSLRLVLWQSGVTPWNLARFLNYCVERRLLQRVGGRYRFLHRELPDYFARKV